MASATQRVKGLDGVRGFAILWVLLFHFYALLPKAAWAVIPGLEGFANLGWIGVSLFFTLSGYLIIPMVADQKSEPGFFARFWCRRAFRLLPVYALLLISFLVARAGWPESSPGRERLLDSTIPLWSYATFTQNIVMASQNYLGNEWLRVSWSLAVEVQFYALACLIVYYVPRRLLVRALLGLIAAVVVFRFGVVLLNPGASASLVLLLPCRLDAFLAGGLVALLPPPLSGQERRRQGIALGVLALSMAAFGWFTSGRFGSVTQYVVPTYYLMLATGSVAVLQLCVLSSPVLRWLMESAPMLRAGRLSYFLYLFHLPVLWMVYGGFFGVMPNLESGRGVALLALVLVVLVGLAEVSHRFLEAPLIRRSHDYFKRRPVTGPGLEPTSAR